MALIVGGTTVTGTQTLDATKLTGDLPAISAANLTNVPAGSPPSDWRNVGSYAFCTNNTILSGTSTTTSGLFQSNAHGSYVSGSTTYTNSGTWRIMGYTASYNYGTASNASLFVRIS